MSSANQSTLAQAVGMGNSLDSMNRVVCRGTTPKASPGTIQDDGYRQRPPDQALRFTGSRWLTGHRAALGVGGRGCPGSRQIPSRTTGGQYRRPGRFQPGFFCVSEQLPRKCTEG